jgi:hypothetical protein
MKQAQCCAVTTGVGELQVARRQVNPVLEGRAQMGTTADREGDMRRDATVRFQTRKGLALAFAAAVGATCLAATADAGPSRPHRHLRGVQRGFEVSSVTPAGPIVAGQNGSAQVVINRNGGHTEAVTLEISANPQAITGTGTIAAAVNTGTLAIAVPAPVAAGSYAVQLDLTDGVKAISVTFDVTVTVTATGTTTLSTARAYHTETLLPNGKVLVTGGRGASSTFLDSADLYDPASGLVNPTTGLMSSRRVSHTATLLNNGKVLIVGGFTGSTTGTATADLYDPASGSFTSTGSLTRARGTHTATLLPNGEVLITGGYSGSKNSLANFPTTCEIYNPGTGVFRDAGSLNAARGAHRATAVFGATFPVAPSADELAAVVDDRVLISGGYAAGAFTKTLEWYSVGSGAFTPLNVSLATGRALHTALLVGNKVLLAGGAVDDGLGFATATAELYNVATNTIGATGALAAKRGGHSSTLAGGKVIVCGGSDFATVQSTVESYDPGTGLFTTLAAPIAAVRTLHTGTLLGSGKILLTGGAYASGFSILYRDTVELYTPPTP